MGALSFSDEFPCPIAPARMFHALFIDAHTLMPKILPHVIKNVEILSGDGGPGSIEQVNYVDGSPIKYAKHRLEALDKENMVCKYSVIESDAFGDEVDCLVNEVKFEAAPSGGCICKTNSTYHPKGNAVLKEEEAKAAKEKAMELFKAVEAYLAANPHVYA